MIWCLTLAMKFVIQIPNLKSQAPKNKFQITNLKFQANTKPRTFGSWNLELEIFPFTTV